MKKERERKRDREIKRQKNRKTERKKERKEKGRKKGNSRWWLPFDGREGAQGGCEDESSVLVLGIGGGS